MGATRSQIVSYRQPQRRAPLVVVSQMPEHGVIFSDGIEADFLQFNSGTQATITLAAQKGYLVE